jgi:hypothetical protein
MAPTTHAQTLDELDTKVTKLSEELTQGLNTLSKQFQEELHQSLNTLSNQFQDFLMHHQGLQPESHPHTSHSSHYENPHLSHSPWGSPNSWNRVPKVEMHKFDGSNPMGGYLKWNNTSPSMIYGMMRPKSMWELCTWIKNDGNGGNGIRNVIQDYQIGPCSPKKFVPILIGNLIFWDDSPSCDKQGQ